jgi:hypothetical protein
MVALVMGMSPVPDICTLIHENHVRTLINRTIGQGTKRVVPCNIWLFGFMEISSVADRSIQMQDYCCPDKSAGQGTEIQVS